ncbi:MAG: pilus assembly protein PilM, partial [Patescibacteria group bacterium]
CRKNKLLEQEVFIVIPDEESSMQILSMPIVSEKEVLSAVELQAEEFIPYPVSQSALDYQVLSVNEKDHQSAIFVVAMLQEIVDRISDFVLDVGLYPKSLEPMSTAFVRLLTSGLFPVPSPLVLLLSVSDSSTQSFILEVKTKQLIMVHNFNMGMSFFHKAIQNNLNLPYVDAVKELRKLNVDSDIAKKVIVPLFGEYSKEIQKILLASTERIGIVPKVMYVYGDSMYTFISLLKQSNAGAGIDILPFTLSTKENQIDEFMPGVAAAV